MHALKSVPIDRMCRQAGDAFFQVIHEFAQNRSNPLLELFGDICSVVEKRKYPKEPLAFNGIGIKAYYHCHSMPDSTNDEHGHFHIFIRDFSHKKKTAEVWCHLVGLAMDHWGQPLRWFTVNRWVTGGSWLPAERLALGMQLLKGISNASLIERWLYSFLMFHFEEIERLLIDRDRAIQRLKSKRSIEDFFESRSYYELNDQPIDLIASFEQLYQTEFCGNV
jgi:hypothetical protein